MDKPPAAASAALPPLEDWRTEHVEQWRLSLPENARIKFKAFFDNLPPEADGSTLASYDLPGLLLVFPKLGAFAPELYAKLQQLKLQAPSGPARAQLRGDVILSECSRTPSQVVNAGVAWEALSIRPTPESAFFPAAWRAPSQTFNVVCPPQSVTEEQVQEAWGQAALSWSSTNPEVLLLDAHDVESLPATPFQHALKPDFVGFNCLNVMNRIHAEGSGELAVRPTRAPGLSAAFSIDLIGEIKKPGNFTPANCGQVLVYAQTSFYVHPDRTHLYAFLANDTHIQFFFFKRQDNTDGIGEVKTTLPLPLSLGTHWLSVLLSQSRVELGRTAPSTFSLIPIRNTVQSFTVKIGSLLGSGRSSVVYLAMTNERDFVVKCFQQSSQPQFASEKEHLLKLQQFAPDGHFPMLLGTAPPESGLVLVLQPRAAPLLSRRGQRARFALTCEEATDLFATLRILHREAHLIHRDISPGNVYHDIPEKLNKVMIADFGFSVRAGICATAAGTLRYAANEVLERWGTGHQIKWVPRYDIESAVKLCFTQVHDCDPNYTPPHSNNSSELLQWWRGMAARKLLLQHALACARKFDQDLDPPMHLYTDVGNLVAKFWDI